MSVETHREKATVPMEFQIEASMKKKQTRVLPIREIQGKYIIQSFAIIILRLQNYNQNPLRNKRYFILFCERYTAASAYLLQLK